MVRLLPYEDAHYEQVRRWLEAPELREYFRRFPPASTWLTCGTARQAFVGHYLVESDERLVGLVCLVGLDVQARRADFGIALEPGTKRGRTAFEAVRLLFDYAFNYLGLNKISSLTLSSRTDLGRFLLRYGFRHEGTLRENIFFAGSFRDEHVYSLLRIDYLDEVAKLEKE